MRWFRLLVIIFCMSILCCSGNAVTIRPGTYKLQWQPITGDAGEIAVQTTYVGLKSKAITDRVKGLKSTRSYWGTTTSFKVIVDESKGLYSGYDTVYLIPTRYADETTDLAQAVSLRLKQKSERELVSDRSATPVEIALGKSIHAAHVSVTVDMEPEDDVQSFTKPWLVSVVAHSGWSGKIKADHGDLNIFALDGNDDGLFGARCVMDSNKKRTLEAGDSVWIGKHQPGCECNSCQTVSLGRACGYAGKLYSIDVSKSGDDVKIQPYTGPTGCVSFKAVDGRNRPVKCGVPWVMGGGGCFDIGVEGDLSLPVGDYRYTIVSIPPFPKEGDVKQFTVVLLSSREHLKVYKGKRTVVKLGGPIKMRIRSAVSKITAKTGEEKDISVDFSIGTVKDRFLFMGQKPVQVNIRDSRGKVVASGVGEFG